MKLPNRQLVSALLTLLVIAGIVALIALKGPLAPVTVEVTRLHAGDLHPAVFGIGTVEARRAYAIGPTRAGRLLTLRVDHGDKVSKRELLGRMDPVDLSERMSSASLVIEKTEHLVEAAQAEVDEAKTLARQARKEQARYHKLTEQHQVSQEEAEKKASDARAAQDRVDMAVAQLAGVRHDYQRSKEDLKALQAQFDELKLFSPANGLIVAREVEPGSVVVAGTPILRMIDPATLWVRARIDQAKSAGIHIGQPADITLRSQPGRPLKGRVERLELIADSLTEERWVDVGFDVIPEDLSIGMLSNVTIHLPRIPQAEWVPGSAIQRRAGKTGVWRVIDARAVFTPVSIGARTLDGKAQVLDGLNSRDRVVAHAPKPLADGDRVKVAAHD